MFQCDLTHSMQLFSADYVAHLNSADVFNLDLPFISSSANGGTLAMWKRQLDPFITVLPTSSDSVLPILFNHPECILSVHITVYLPTRGKESEFLQALAILDNTIEEVKLLHSGAELFVRGDANVNPRNSARFSLLKHFVNENSLHSIDFGHPTYHHFLGDGASDSQLDVILLSNKHSEKLVTIHCKLDDPLINSHHDLIISSFILTLDSKVVPDQTKNIVAPRIQNDRLKVTWDDEGIEKYKQIAPYLSELFLRWNDPSSKSSVSVLLQTTNSFLSHVASKTNQAIALNKKVNIRSRNIPRPISISYGQMLSANRKYKALVNSTNATEDQIASAKSELKNRRTSHRRLVRSTNASASIKRDGNLNVADFAQVQKSLKQSKSQNSSDLQTLTVANKVYTSPNIPDGFFDSLSTLKTQQNEFSSPQSQRLLDDYDNIIEICSQGPSIPPISLKDSTEILLNLKPSVNDFFSITANHFIKLGGTGLQHFNNLMNLLISDTTLICSPELNSVYANILYKGHKKDKTSERSYRTISTCPLIAKALDTYLRRLNMKVWMPHEAETQFQGEGSSHELAGLLLTETIQRSMYHLIQPLYTLYLDALSAFDRVIIEFLIRNLYLTGTKGQELLFIKERLKNRLTFCEWNKDLMGPIADTKGVEQGGVNSDMYYKMTNKEQLQSAQDSELGVLLHDIVISSIGLADDVVLTSNNLSSLNCLLHLTKIYCSKNHVKLVPDKTKLQLFLPKNLKIYGDYFKCTNSLVIDSMPISFVEETDHVGITRSVNGNLPHLLHRVSSFKKAMSSALHVGIARKHRGNPAAALRVLQVYGIPVLTSGVASLVLNKSESDIMEKTVLDSLLNLQKLIQKTPRPVVCFLAGSLPGIAILHLRQLSIFGMITRLPDSILNSLARSSLVCDKVSSRSWFHQIRELCIQYNLPHPLCLLDYPPSKLHFKSLTKRHVYNYWEESLQKEATQLSSLKYFHPHHMSLSNPHPIWSMAGSNPFEVSKATVQARMLSGRYPTDHLSRHWYPSRSGKCLLPLCATNESAGTLEHILLFCPSLAKCRQSLISLADKLSLNDPITGCILATAMNNLNSTFTVQFLLDCSSLTLVKDSVSIYGPEVLQKLFYFSRTWCYNIHRRRCTLLGLWSYR